MADIAKIAEELARAVELTMDPCLPQEQRMEAYTACERFKETSPLCVQCGLHLAQQNNVSHFVRHFGLQLMEHCVKYRWNHMSQQEKLFIKVHIIQNLLYPGG
jgi:exportin-5